MTEQQTAPAKACELLIADPSVKDVCAYESGVEGNARELLGLTGLSCDTVGSVLDGGGHGVGGESGMRGDGEAGLWQEADRLTA